MGHIPEVLGQTPPCDRVPRHTAFAEPLDLAAKRASVIFGGAGTDSDRGGARSVGSDVEIAGTDADTARQS